MHGAPSDVDGHHITARSARIKPQAIAGENHRREAATKATRCNLNRAVGQTGKSEASRMIPDHSISPQINMKQSEGVQLCYIIAILDSSYQYMICMHILLNIPLSLLSGH